MFTNALGKGETRKSEKKEEGACRRSILSVVSPTLATALIKRVINIRPAVTGRLGYHFTTTPLSPSIRNRHSPDTMLSSNRGRSFFALKYRSARSIQIDRYEGRTIVQDSTYRLLRNIFWMSNTFYDKKNS